MGIIHNINCPIHNAKILSLPPRHIGVPWFQIDEIIEYINNKKNIDDINFEINSEIIRLQNEYFKLKQNKITENESKEEEELLKKRKKKEKKLRQQINNNLEKNKKKDDNTFNQILKEVEDECKNNNQYKNNNINSKSVKDITKTMSNINNEKDKISNYEILIVNKFKDFEIIKYIIDKINNNYKKNLDIKFLEVGHVEAHKSIYIIFKKKELNIMSKIYKLKELISKEFNKIDDKYSLKKEIKNKLIINELENEQDSNIIVTKLKFNNIQEFNIIIDKIKKIHEKFKIKNLLIKRGENFQLELIYLLTEDNITNKIICLSNYINTEIQKLVKAKKDIENLIKNLI